MTEIRDIRSSAELRNWIPKAYANYLDELVAIGAVYERDANGVWQPDLLPYWLTEADCTALAFMRDDAPIAFAFVGLETFPFRRHPTQFCLAEFWVAPEQRGTGIGAAFARALWKRLPGSWELTVLPRNDAALAFWRTVLPAPRETPSEDGIDFVFEVVE